VASQLSCSAERLITFCGFKKLKSVALYGKAISKVRSVTCHMGSHTSVIYYPTQVTEVNALRLNPSQTGRYSTYLLRKDERLSSLKWCYSLQFVVSFERMSDGICNAILSETARQTAAIWTRLSRYASCVFWDRSRPSTSCQNSRYFLRDFVWQFLSPEFTVFIAKMFRIYKPQSRVVGFSWNFHQNAYKSYKFAFLSFTFVSGFFWTAWT